MTVGCIVKKENWLDNSFLLGLTSINQTQKAEKAQVSKLLMSGSYVADTFCISTLLEEDENNSHIELVIDPNDENGELSKRNSLQEEAFINSPCENTNLQDSNFAINRLWELQKQLSSFTLLKRLSLEQ